MEVVKELLFGYYLPGFIILSLILIAFFLAKKALGVNLYSDTRTIIEEYGLDMCRQKLEEKSEFMLELSGESVEAVSETLDEAIIRMTFTEEEDGEGLSLFMWGLGNLNHQYIDEIYLF